MCPATMFEVSLSNLMRTPKFGALPFTHCCAMEVMSKSCHFAASPDATLTADDWSLAVVPISPPWVAHFTPPVVSYQVAPSPVHAPTADVEVPSSQSCANRYA